MRESDRNLDSPIAAGAKHLKPVKQPAKLTSDDTSLVAPPSVHRPSLLPERPASARPLLHHSAARVTASDCLVAGSDQEVSERSVLRERILTWLRKNVPNSRLQHILRVEQMSADLAKRHQVDVAQAALAGLTHDLAKFFKPQCLLQMAQAEGLTIDPVELANPHLLHAAVGAIVARDEFGICDDAVLDAIRHHTLGCPGMSALSCIVFLADSLEPGRGDTPELEALRRLSQQDLHHAVWQTCDESLHHLLARSQQIHPRMVLTRNWALALTDKKPSDKKLLISRTP
ncbi:MAG TPA: bis(5'-nucleosyl)-tetraphosphatase (symmetrical) YqeK [Candidatus Sericytochromatia bacterium]